MGNGETFGEKVERGFVHALRSVKQKQGFSQYEAEFPELRSEWWETRKHRADAEFFAREWDEFVDAIRAFEAVCSVGRWGADAAAQFGQGAVGTGGATRSPRSAKASKALVDVHQAIERIQKSSGSLNFGKLQSKDKAKFLARQFTGNMHKGANFQAALEKLKKMIEETPQFSAAGGGEFISNIPDMYRI